MLIYERRIFSSSVYALFLIFIFLESTVRLLHNYRSNITDSDLQGVIKKFKRKEFCGVTDMIFDLGEDNELLL